MTTQSAGPMTKEKMEEYFKSFNEAGSTKTITEYYTEDAGFKTPWGKDFKGRDNICKYLYEVAHYKDKIKETLMPNKILIDGDDVAVELITQFEALEDVPDFHLGTSFTKGQKMQWRLSAFYTIKEGKIDDVQIYVVAEEWLRKWLG
jgi:ketosteroid isomerase-like protein